MRVAVIGAGGLTGTLVGEELERRGHTLSAGPDASERPTVERFLAEAEPEVIIVTTGPASAVADVLVPAAVAAGVHVVDASFEQAHVRALHDRWGGSTAGVAIVPAAGLAFLVGDLLGAVAGAAATDTTELHIAYAVPRFTDLVGAWSPGTRRSGLAALAGEGLVLRDGHLTEEGAGESRRLAWFPRPVGPHHAAGVPGGEAVSLPRHVGGLRTVATYLALPSLLAEVLQAAARSLRGGGGRGRLADLVTRGGPPGEDRRRDTRWACVAEAPSEGGVVRAWAYGTDPYAFAAAALVLVAEQVASPGAPTGVLAPGELGDPAALLDELALRTGARWSLRRPHD